MDIYIYIDTVYIYIYMATITAINKKQEARGSKCRIEADVAWSTDHYLGSKLRVQRVAGMNILG